jgi:hypothetical protein
MDLRLPLQIEISISKTFTFATKFTSIARRKKDLSLANFSVLHHIFVELRLPSKW